MANASSGGGKLHVSLLARRELTYSTHSQRASCIRHQLRQWSPLRLAGAVPRRGESTRALGERRVLTPLFRRAGCPPHPLRPLGLLLPARLSRDCKVPHTIREGRHPSTPAQKRASQDGPQLCFGGDQETCQGPHFLVLRSVLGVICSRTVGRVTGASSDCQRHGHLGLGRLEPAANPACCKLHSPSVGADHQYLGQALTLPFL